MISRFALVFRGGPAIQKALSPRLGCPSLPNRKARSSSKGLQPVTHFALINPRHFAAFIPNRLLLCTYSRGVQLTSTRAFRKVMTHVNSSS